MCSMQLACVNVVNAVQSVCRTLSDMGVPHEEKFLQNLTSAILLPSKVALHPEGPSMFCRLAAYPCALL